MNVKVCNWIRWKRLSESDIYILYVQIEKDRNEVCQVQFILNVG